MSVSEICKHEEQSLEVGGIGRHQNIDVLRRPDMPVEGTGYPAHRHVFNITDGEIGQRRS